MKMVIRGRYRNYDVVQRVPGNAQGNSVATASRFGVGELLDRLRDDFSLKNAQYQLDASALRERSNQRGDAVHVHGLRNKGGISGDYYVTCKLHAWTNQSKFKRVDKSNRALGTFKIQTTRKSHNFE